MSEDLLNGLRYCADNLTKIATEGEQLNLLRQNYHDGEVATLTLEIGGLVVNQRALTANGKTIAVDNFFEMWETQLKAQLWETICDLQTFKSSEENPE